MYIYTHTYNNITIKSIHSLLQSDIKMDTNGFETFFGTLFNRKLRIVIKYKLHLS